MRMIIGIFIISLSFLSHACSPSANVLPTETVDRIQPTETVNSASTQVNLAIPTQSSTADILIGYSPATVLVEDEHRVRVEHLFPPGLLESQGMVVLNAENLDVKAGNIILDYLTWDGVRIPMMDIEFSGGHRPDGFSMSVGSVPSLSSGFLLNINEFLGLSEFYYIEPLKGVKWGINHECSESIYWDHDVLLGPDHVALQCRDSIGTWYLLQVNDPTNFEFINLGLFNHDLTWYRPRWASETKLFVEDMFHRGFCLIDFFKREPTCSETTDWFGGISPDGNYMEVRLGQYNTRPENVGFQLVGCDPIKEDCMRTTIPGWIPSDGIFRLERAAWFKNSQGLLYTVHIETDSSNLDSDETEFYLLDIETMSVELVGHYEKYLTFNPINPSPRPNLWSPDGKWIVVNEGTDYYLLSIETGELKPFTQGGYILGEIDLSGLAPQ